VTAPPIPICGWFLMWICGSIVPDGTRSRIAKGMRKPCPVCKADRVFPNNPTVMQMVSEATE
jgi:hypothetical protein